MSRIIESLKPVVSDETTRKAVYKAIIPAMQDADWDTEMECLGEDAAYDEVLKECHPTWFEDMEQ